MTATQPPEAQTRAASGRDKAAQRMKDLKRAAMRLAVYVRELGVEPVALRGNAYREWERALQKQYQELRDSLGKEAGQAARVRGRALIRRVGLSSAVPDLAPAPTRTQRKKVGGSKPQPSGPAPETAAAITPVAAPARPVEPPVASNPAVCRRKLRHSSFLSAMLHARQIHSPGLHVYGCECRGLHVGHLPGSRDTQRGRAVTKRLRSIEKQLAAIETRADELRHERQTLLAEQEIRTDAAPRSKLRQFLLRIEAWLAKLET